MNKVFTNLYNNILNYIFFQSSSTSDKSYQDLHNYDNLIKYTLNSEKIPKVKHNYILPEHTTKMNVSSLDIDTFQKLFYIVPPKKNLNEGTNRNVGNGELSLYWLFKYQDKNISPYKDVSPKIESSCSDLVLVLNDNNTYSLEIKNYPLKTERIKHGRFSSDKFSLGLLNIVFSLYNIFSPTYLFTDDKILNPTNFSYKDLLEVFSLIFNKSKSFSDLNINNKFEFLLKNLDYPKTPEEATKRLILRLVKTKLEKKPGNNNFLLNVDYSGLLSIFFVNLDSLDLISDEILSNSIDISQSSLYINPYKLF